MSSAARSAAVKAVVTAVSRSATHSFSKPTYESIALVAALVSMTTRIEASP